MRYHTFSALLKVDDVAEVQEEEETRTEGYRELSQVFDKMFCLVVLSVTVLCEYRNTSRSTCGTTPSANLTTIVTANYDVTSLSEASETRMFRAKGNNSYLQP